MAPSRRTSNPTLRWGSLALAVGLCVFFGAAGLGYVWHRNRNDQLEAQIRRKQAKLEELRTLHVYLDRQLEDLRSHRLLAQRVRELNLGLTMPEPAQILRVLEWPTGTVCAGTRPSGNAGAWGQP